MMKAVRYWSVIPAAGFGVRMNSNMPKQYLTINGKSILEYSLETFCQNSVINGVIVAIAEDDSHWDKLEIASHPKITKVIGGKERCDSVLNSLRLLTTLAAPEDWVMVHDAVRPCLRKEDIEKLINKVGDHPVGGLLALPVLDTMKRTNENNEIKETVERECLWHALTPQMFHLADLQMALDSCIKNKQIVTDEAQAMELSGYTPILVEGHSDNIKVTQQSDLKLIKLYLSQ